MIKCQVLYLLFQHAAKKSRQKRMNGIEGLRNQYKLEMRYQEQIRHKTRVLEKITAESGVDPKTA
jgi:phosphomevalonate kinase